MPARLSARVVIITIGFAVCACAAAAVAQQPTPTPALDRRGLPLPYGVQPYYMPDVPLGSGAYKAIMAVPSGLTEQVVYYPKDLSKLGTRKLPVLLWANGSCLYAGNRYRQFLTEIASHGYLVIAGGPMGDKELEVGPQQNPAVRAGGPGANTGQAAPAAATAAPATPARGGVDAGTAPVAGRVTPAIMKKGLDWAFAQNADATSPLAGKVDTQHVVMWGHSCGGGVAIQEATTDSRVTALGVWHSGLNLGGRGNSDPAILQKIKGPVLILSGTEQLDSAYGTAKNTFEKLEVPAFYGWRDSLQHIGTFGALNGGEQAVIAVKWLDWQTRNDPAAAKWFKGPACTLCKDPAWHIQKKKID